MAEIERRGFVIVPDATSPASIEQILAVITPHLAETSATDDPTLRGTLRSRGTVVAARDLLERCPRIADLWKSPALVALLAKVLGRDCGLVRVLYFDKPPTRTWGLPWHKDRTIAVREHLPELSPFAKPTVKAGVPHLEAPESLLRQMLTLRLHLDDVDLENGALQVIPGSHESEPETSAPDAAPQIVSINVRAGDCLAMRPLLCHASGPSRAGTMRHRRVLHLEFAAAEQLPAGYHWRNFVRML